VVLQHLLRLPQKFLVQSREALSEGEGYFADEPDLDNVYQLALEYFDTFGGEYLTYDALSTALSEPEQLTLRDTIRRWYALPEDHEWSITMVREEIKEFQARAEKESLQEYFYDDSVSRDSLREQLKSSLHRIDRDIFGSKESQNPFDDMEGNLQTAVRIPSGVDFLDEVLEGGVRPGECLGFVIPTSGGKTTLGLQIADAQVRQGKYVAYLSSEQRLQGDISVRCFTLAARTYQGAFKEGWSQVEPHIQEVLRKQKPSWKKYFHFFDCTDLNVPTVAQAFSPVRDMVERGMRPSFVVIDWWGRLKNRIMQAQPHRLSDNQERKLQQELLQNVKDEAESLGVTVVVLHQMAGAVAERGPKHKPSSHSAQEDKNFNNMMDFCFTFPKKDAHNRTRCIADKARSSGNNEVPLVLDGAHCLFRMQDGPDHFMDDMALPEPALSANGPDPASAYDLEP
jgi:RecA/RadA recombinase